MDLRELRQRANLRIIDIVEQVRVSERSVLNWEHGRAKITLRLDQLSLLAKLYGCTIDNLYEAMRETQAKVEKTLGNQAADKG